jgi:predicted nucleic acid-binding protein
LLLEGLDTVATPPDKRPSFVDCLVMATANANNTREIFGFDAVFAKNGYFLPGTSQQKTA